MTFFSRHVDCSIGVWKNISFKNGGQMTLNYLNNKNLLKKLAFCFMGILALGQPALAESIETAIHAETEFMNPPRYPGPGPVRPGPVRPGPVRPEPGRPPRPYPPERPPRPPGNPGYVDEQKSVYLGQRFFNQTIRLRELLGIGPQYRGYVVDSVLVDLRGATYNTNLSLMINGRIADSAYSPNYSAILYPQFEDEIGSEVQSLELRIDGVADIDSITVNLRRGNGYDHGNPANDVVVPVVVYRRLMGNDRLDLGQYVNLWNYQGYRLAGIELNARAVYGSASLDILVNGFNAFNPVWLNQYSAPQLLFPNQNLIIGRGADSIVLYSRGDIELNHINLRLSRR